MRTLIGCAKIVTQIAGLLGITFIWRTVIPSRSDDAITFFFNSLCKINVLYAKLFQSIALDICPQSNSNIRARLLSFTDNVPFISSDVDADMLKTLESEYSIRFANNSGKYVPFKSGMVSLIFREQTGIGKLGNTILKMRRPHMDKQLDTAIDQIFVVLDGLSMLSWGGKYKMKELVTNHVNSLRSQLDFSQEVENMIQMRENCAGLKYVVIPYPHADITRQFPSVILMEYIDGVHLTDVPPSDYVAFAKQVIKFGAVTSFLHGCAHGDLHAGNLLFIKDAADAKYPHKIGVIDFGIVFTIDQTFQSNLLAIFSELFITPAVELAEQIIESGIIEPVSRVRMLPQLYRQRMIQELADIIEASIGPVLPSPPRSVRIAPGELSGKLPGKIFDGSDKSPAQKQVGLYEFLHRFYIYLDKTDVSVYNLYPSDDMVKLQGALMMAQGVTFSLCGENHLKITQEVINELFHLDVLM